MERSVELCGCLGTRDHGSSNSFHGPISSRGTRIVPLQGATKLYDKPGIWREVYFHTGWGAYKCPDAEHRQIIFESMDRDHRNRRLSPTSVLTELNGKRYMALYTGPGRYKIDWSGKIKNCDFVGNGP